MTQFQSLEHYLQELKKCTNQDQLKDEFKLSPNWPILFYGNTVRLFPKIEKAFHNSLAAQNQQNKQVVQEPWHYQRSYLWYGDRYDLTTAKLTSIEEAEVHDYRHGTEIIEAEIASYPHYNWIKTKNKRNNIPHSMHLIFHLIHKEETRETNYQTLAKAIVDLGEYAINNKIAIEMPKRN